MRRISVLLGIVLSVYCVQWSYAEVIFTKEKISNEIYFATKGYVRFLDDCQEQT